MTTGAIPWRVAVNLIWTRYPDSGEWIVYHPGSCDAHLLTASARLLWTLLDGGQYHTIEQLAAALAADLGRASDEELVTVTQDTVAFMDRAGLLYPTGS